MFNYLKFITVLVVFTLSSVSATLAWGQASATLQDEIEQAANTLKLKVDSPLKTAQEKDLLAAQQLLVNTKAAEEQALAFKSTAEREDALIAKLKANLAALLVSELRAVPSDDEAQTQQLAEYEALLLAKRGELDELVGQKSTLANRAGVISKELSRLQSARDEEQSKENSSDPIKSLLANAVLTELRQRISTLQTELTTMPQRQRILEVKIELARLEYERTADYVARLKLAVSENRVLLAKGVLQRAQEQLTIAQNTAPALTPIAEETLRLAKKLVEITENTAVLGDTSSKMNGIYQRISASNTTVERVLAAGELTDDTASLLRRVQSGLPDINSLKSLLDASTKTQTDLQLRTILWEDRLQVIGRISVPDIDFLKVQLNDKNPPQDLLEMEDDQARSLQTLRREVLIKLIDAARIDLERRTNADIALRETIQLTQALKTRLERRLLWLRTNDSSPQQALKNLPTGFTYLLSPSNWTATIKEFFDKIKRMPFMLIFLIVIPGLLYSLRPSMKRRLSKLSARVGVTERGRQSDSYWVTPAAFVVTILIAIPFALVLLSAGAILQQPKGTVNFTQAFSFGLSSTASVFIVLFIFKTMCLDRGLLGAHLGWSEQSKDALFKHLRWFTPIGSVMTFLFVMGVYENIPELRYGLGLLAFVVLSIAISVMTYVFFQPKGGIAASIVMDTPASPVITFVFPILVALPLLVGLAPLFGYFDTAVELQARIFRTGVMSLAVAILYGLLLRNINIAQARYALKREEQRTAQELSALKTKAQSDKSGEASPTIVDEQDDDHLSNQIRKMLYTLSSLVLIFGLFYIWGPLLPALGIADDITLWEQTRQVDGEEVVRAVTLSSLFIAAFILFASLVAARNVKAILELLAFDRLTMDSGTRYATVTIFGYILVGFGVVISLALIGLDWSKLQWIVAALGVGIGFGLQEIIANFISGIIILFERPVRVGDIVTINNLSGTVNNIKIRATTITDFDNREVLLPNKAIITGEVTNWTLHNAVTRLIIPVGVAYGSDVAKVRDILTSVIEANPDVLVDPAPTVFFVAHGDSSLDFEIRLFVATPMQRLPVTHDVNAGINAALTAHNIEIPFPQRDIHIKGGPALKAP